MQNTFHGRRDERALREARWQPECLCQGSKGGALITGKSVPVVFMTFNEGKERGVVTVACVTGSVFTVARAT